MLVRTEGLLTQLVFEHSLRARMAFDVSPTSSSTIVIDELSADGPTSTMKRSAENVEAGSSSSPSPSPDPRASTPDRKSKEEISQKAATVKETEASNLFGKINNLVTTDLANIVGGRDVLVLGMHSFSFCITTGTSLLLDSRIHSSSNYPVFGLFIQDIRVEVSLLLFILQRLHMC